MVHSRRRRRRGGHVSDDQQAWRRDERGPRHGYAIADWIETPTDGDVQIEDASLYTALHELEDRGWVSAEWGLSEKGKRAKFYRLTTVGHTAPQSHPGVGALCALSSRDPRRDVDDEFVFHLTERIEALVARGVPRDVAEAEARRRFGDLANVAGGDPAGGMSRPVESRASTTKGGPKRHGSDG